MHTPIERLDMESSRLRIGIILVREISNIRIVTDVKARMDAGHVGTVAGDAYGIDVNPRSWEQIRLFGLKELDPNDVTL